MSADRTGRSIRHLNDLEHVRRTIQQFWSFVTKTDSCWLWTGTGPTLNGKKRAYFRVKTMLHGYTNVPAARFSYIVHNECIPEGKIITHNCDNPLCVRPDHLSASTYRQNIRDAMERIIWKEQREHDRAMADEIRAYYAQGYSYVTCSRRFGIPKTTLVRIVKREFPYD